MFYFMVKSIINAEPACPAGRYISEQPNVFVQKHMPTINPARRDQYFFL